MLIERVGRVQMEDMEKVAHSYMAPLFDPAKSFTTVVCHTSKCETVAQSFAELVF